jgi:hypothetical protein
MVGLQVAEAAEEGDEEADESRFVQIIDRRVSSSYQGSERM